MIFTLLTVTVITTGIEDYEALGFPLPSTCSKETFHIHHIWLLYQLEIHWGMRHWECKYDKLWPELTYWNLRLSSYLTLCYWFFVVFSVLWGMIRLLKMNVVVCVMCSCAPGLWPGAQLYIWGMSLSRCLTDCLTVWLSHKVKNICQYWC